MIIPSKRSSLIYIIEKYASSLDEFVLKNGDEICKTKILDIRVPKVTSNMISAEDINNILDGKNIRIQIGEF